MGQSFLYTSLAVCEALVDQQWTQVFTLAGLSKVLSAMLKVDTVQALLQKLFKVSVPIINGASDKHAEGWKVENLRIGFNSAGFDASKSS